MKKSICSEQTHNFFELISRHFADKYYNILYSEANKRRNMAMDGRSMTDCYCDVILHYLNIFKKNNNSKESKKYYNMDLRNLIQFYCASTNQNLNTSQFVELFLKHMFHEKLYNHLANNTKDTIMFRIMSDVVFSLTNELKNNLSIIIDDRTTANYINIKRIVLDILVMEKQNLFNDYVAIVTKNKPGETPLMTQDKLKKELENIGNKHNELQKKYNNLLNICNILKKELDTYKQKNTTLDYKPNLLTPKEMFVKEPNRPINLYTEQVKEPVKEQIKEQEKTKEPEKNKIIKEKEIKKEIDEESDDNEDEDEDEEDVGKELLQSIMRENLARSSMCIPSSRTSLDKEFDNYF